MVLKAFAAVAITGSLFGAAVTRYRRRRSLAMTLTLVGSACFVLVAATHVFESLHLLTSAGWGQPQSVGHYIDLTVAVLGLASLLAGVTSCFVWFLRDFVMCRRAAGEPSSRDHRDVAGRTRGPS